jgi:hypothetical protein
VASATPTLPNVPRHPRGDAQSPCVLIWAGGVLPGINAVVPMMLTGSHEWSQRMVARNESRVVCGTTSNVQVVAAVVPGEAFGSPVFG